MLSILRITLAATSFCIYAFAVLHQGNYLKMGCYAECADALPGAVSYTVYGTKLGKVEREVERVFHSYAANGTAARAIEDTNKGTTPTGETRIALDGSGVGYLIFASLAMKLFGPHIVALPLALLALMAVSAIAFIVRFQDDRLFVVPALFFALCAMLLTWQNTLPDSINQGAIGGYRYMVVLAIIPAFHLLFEILDRGPAAVFSGKFLLVALQSGVLALAIILRSSTIYVLIGAAIAALIVFLRSRKDPSVRWKVAKIGVCGAMISAVIIASMIASVPTEYIRTGRVFGNVWHRTFISLSMHARWPYGSLEQMFPCPKKLFPQGIASPRWDSVGWCAWWATKTDPKTGEPINHVDRPEEYYDSTYEWAMRAAFFRVLRAYPKQVLETFYRDKSIMLISTLRDGLTISWFDVPRGIFPLFLLQCASFLLFVVISAFSAPLSRVLWPVVSGLWALSAIPGYVAWHTVQGCPDLIAFMYLFFALCLATAVQGITLAVAGRSRVLLPGMVSGGAFVGFLALMAAVNLFDFGEIQHPLIAPHIVPRPDEGVSIKSATYGASCGAPQGNVTRAVALTCNGKPDCAYPIGAEALGDPAPGCAKDFRVSYSCAPDTTILDRQLSSEVNKGTSLDLNCAHAPK